MDIFFINKNSYFSHTILHQCSTFFVTKIHLNLEKDKTQEGQVQDSGSITQQSSQGHSLPKSLLRCVLARNMKENDRNKYRGNSLDVVDDSQNFFSPCLVVDGSNECGVVEVDPEVLKLKSRCLVKACPNRQRLCNQWGVDAIRYC